jgi:hypothetical protein
MRSEHRLTRFTSKCDRVDKYLSFNMIYSFLNVNILGNKFPRFFQLFFSLSSLKDINKKRRGKIQLIKKFNWKIKVQ